MLRHGSGQHNAAATFYIIQDGKLFEICTSAPRFKCSARESLTVVSQLGAGNGGVCFHYWHTESVSGSGISLCACFGHGCGMCRYILLGNGGLRSGVWNFQGYNGRLEKIWACPAHCLVSQVSPFVQAYEDPTGLFVLHWQRLRPHGCCSQCCKFNSYHVAVIYYLCSVYLTFSIPLSKMLLYGLNCWPKKVRVQEPTFRWRNGCVSSKMGSLRSWYRVFSVYQVRTAVLFYNTQI